MIRFQILAVVLSCCASVPARETPQETAHVYRYANTVDVGAITRESMVEAYARFQKLATAGAKQITLRIDSPGGSISLGFTWSRLVEDIKRNHGIRVTCIVDGSVYSMAAVILQSPVCDVRLATVRSTILFHNGSSQTEGTVNDVIGDAELLEALNTAMGMTVAMRLEIPYAMYRERISKRSWSMALPEAIVSNVVDGFASSFDIAPPVEIAPTEPTP